MKEALYILGDVIHHLQRERGCSAMYLCSEGRLFSERLEQQFIETDKIFKIFNEGWQRWEKNKSLKSQNIQKLKSVLENTKSRRDIRNQIIHQTITVSQSLEYYTHELIYPLLQNSIEIALHMEGANPTFVSAFNSFMHWKERIGMERAIGVRGFIGYDFHNNEFVDRILFLLSEQKNDQNTFMALANESQQQIVQRILNGTHCLQLDHLHDLLRTAPESKELHSLKPESWFELITAKIDDLQQIFNKLIDSIIDKQSHSYENNNLQYAAPSPMASSTNGITKYNQLIESLQIFSGLSVESLQTLMQNAQIREFNKGKLLFLEGEQANRLYIILSGWIKIFKGTSNGDEAVLSMLSSGDTIMETAVYLNLKFPISAQVVENATILSLPAPMVREQIKKNNKLAQNLLSSMCYRSHSLIRQIEVARLKTVDERIGWFLLKLALEQGHNSRYIQLPYDKSLIASYLDMKRETFSRALKRFKQKGFIIENDIIILPHQTSLCEFCDHSIADKCPHHDSTECPHNHEFQNSIALN